MRKTAKVFFTFFILYPAVLFSTVASAQNFSLGVKAGGSLNWAAFGDKGQKDTFDTKMIFGYSAGFQIGFPLKNNYELLTEGGFSREGRRITFNEGKWENRSIFYFADATMLLRKNFPFQLRKNVPAQWFVTLGPEVSYWVKSKGRIIIEEPGFEYNVVFNKPPDGNLKNMYYNDVNRWLFGLVLGVGVKAPLKRKQHIAAELRFISGHTYLGTRNSSTIAILTFDDTMLTNLKSINLVVTYYFDFSVQESRKGKSTLKKKLKKNR
jgi:hypothetical protein